tara:strand:- start:4098 stop:4322 length:225 start_codon:yes stop_codon:yes gene_type:complete
VSKKPGLWANIHAKRKRIKSGSGERMREKGEKGAPTPSQMKAAQGFKLGGPVKKSKHRGCGAVMEDRRKTTNYS